MLVVDPATQRSLVVRQSDEREALRRSHQMSAPIRKPHRVFKSRAINRAEIFSTAPGESTFRGFDRQSPARKALGRRKCGLALGPLGESSLFAFVLRDSRGKEGNLEVRRSSGPLQPSWMAVQPPVTFIVIAVSITTTSRSTHIALQFHLPFSPHLGEPPRCVCCSAFLTSSRADWLFAAEWGFHKVAFSSVAAAVTTTVSFTEEEIGESVLTVRVRVPCRRFRSPLPLQSALPLRRFSAVGRGRELRVGRLRPSRPFLRSLELVVVVVVEEERRLVAEEGTLIHRGMIRGRRRGCQ